jgi:hypothetical protein
VSLQIEKQRSRRKQKGKFKIRVRYKHDLYRTIETEDYGTFREMFAKYKGKYEFWCGDVPPEKQNGEYYSGVRLDSDVYPGHEEYSLQKFGKNKCWIDENYKINGKKVCLVFNAQIGLDTSIGATGTIIGGSVALSTAQRLERERRRRKAKRKVARYRTRRDGRKYRKR